MQALLCLLLASSFAATLGAPVEVNVDRLAYRIKSLNNTNLASTASVLTCDLCEGIVAVLQQLLETNVAEDEIVKIVIAFCIDRKIEDENVCRSIVPLFKVKFLLHAHLIIYLFSMYNIL